MRRVLAGIGVAGLIVAGAMAGSASAARSSHLTRIERPRTEQIVGNGKVHVVLRTRVGLRSMRIHIHGRSIKRFLHRTKRGYRGVLQLRRGLRSGVNDLIVATRGRRDVDHVRFIVARRSHKLLTMRKPRFGGLEAPARVVVTAARRSTLQAWLNGRRVTHAFLQQRRAYVGRLGANDGVRPGRNRLVVYVYRTARHGRVAVHDVERLTFRRPRGRVIAGAGRDRRFRAGDFITLRGSAVGGGARSSKAARVKHGWRIVRQPRNAGAVLTRARTATPQLRAKKAGIYRVRTRVTARNGSTSTDTFTATVTEKVPPIGSRLSTTDDRGTITLNGNAVDNTTWTATCASGPCVSWAVFDRATLRLVESGKGSGDAAGMAALAQKAAGIVPGPAATMIVNLSGASAALPDGKKLLATLGAPDIARPAIARPMSIVGVPGSPAGSAFVSDPSIQCPEPPACPAQPQSLANMSGYLRENQRSANGGFFEFVFADQREFTTNATPGTSQITMKVGEDTYAHDVPANASGFFLVLLNSQTLELNRPPQFFVTNDAAGTENPAEEKRMADLLAYAASDYNSHGEVLVMLQSFGRPRGLDGAWLQAAAAIDGLGGNAQVFTQLNQGNPESPEQGGYALVGRPAMDDRAAESSGSLTGNAGDGKLGGLLARGRDNRYQPSLSDPGGAVNGDLVTIVNGPSPPGGGFPEWPNAGQAAAADYLGRNKDVLNVCQDAPAPCDIRGAYYTKFTGWDTRLAQLNGIVGQTACKQTGLGFKEADCNAVREQFAKEIGARNMVQDYFGPKGLQAPFSDGGAGLNAQLIDVPAVAAEIKAGVPVFPPNNTISHVFSIMNFVLEKATAGASLFGCEECEGIAFGLGNAFELAEYLTEDDGTPDVVGPAVTSAATKLGGDLKERYSRVSAYFTNEARVVMSDYSKLTQVARLAGSDPGWALPEDPARSAKILEFATKKTAYQALVPVAYPFLYSLGKSPGYTNPFDNARQWLCEGDPLNISYNKHLFQKTGDNSQMKWRRYEQKYFGQTHVMAVGARHTVLSLHSAYVPAPPDALTAKLFGDPRSVSGGMGFDKLSFFSPPNFKVFQTVLQQRSGVGFEYCHNVPDPPGEAQ